MSADHRPYQQNKPGYALSSWNYGSFHNCNPYHIQQHNMANENIKQKNEFTSHTRAHSANPNRILPAEEKIVTEDYLIMMKEFKAIKSNDNTTIKLKKNKSSAQLIARDIYDDNLNNQSTSQFMMNTSSQYSNKKNSIKAFKYQLSFDEWAAVKAKQLEISKKVKIIKESEDQNFEYFNKKIDENYKIIQ